jgi:flagellar assembly protein FliH
MSTSLNRALDMRLRPAIQPFLYVEAVRPVGPITAEAVSVAAREDGAEREAAAHLSGRLEGEAQARAVGERELHAIREGVSAALRDFARERETYYQQVEAEVVRLALSIARKILHREAQIDPLLLAGLVRVTLEQMERGTKVVVRASPDQVAEWRGFFGQHIDSDSVPEVEEDSTLEANHCRLQTTMGTTEMGVEVQLQEIERGLLDLLAQRPQAGA